MNYSKEERDELRRRTQEEMVTMISPYNQDEGLLDELAHNLLDDLDEAESQRQTDEVLLKIQAQKIDELETKLSAALEVVEAARDASDGLSSIWWGEGVVEALDKFDSLNGGEGE